MSLDVFNAYVQGYTDRLFDLQLISVEAGYWSGYFGRSKKPKALNVILEKMARSRNKGTQKHVEEVDVNKFLEQERHFNQMRSEVK